MAKHFFLRFYKSWFFTDILVPFLLTRSLLILIGLLVHILPFPINPDYPIVHVMVDRWHFTNFPLVDMWMRWDTGWYFQVASKGYIDQASLGTNYSSLAFFPMYPGLARLLLNLIGAKITATTFGLVGILISNLGFLAGLVGLHRLAHDLLNDPQAGKKAVLWALVFPVSFFFSAVYTESIWFAFSVFSLLAGHRKRWALAAVLGVMAVMTRVQGILIVLPLAWLYMAEREWNFRKLDLQVLWLGLPGLALLGWFAALYTVSGSWIAPITAQGGWGRTFGWPWQSLLFPTVYLGYITRLEQIFLLAGLALVFWALWKSIIRAEGSVSPAHTLYALALLLLPLFGGSTHSGLRYLLAVFPIYFLFVSVRLPHWGRAGLALMFLVLQLILFSRWCLFYWVG